jgi:hypothetical protein
MACGRYDLDVRQRAFWMRSFGQQVTQEQLIDMHPLRRLERTPEERGDAGEAGWAMLGAGLKAINEHRGK